MARLSILVAAFACVWASVLATDGTECPTAPSSAEDRRSDQTKLRVVQYNAEWLFIDGYDNCPGSTCPWKNSTAAYSHLDHIAQVVQDLNPDIINFCEVESCDELKLLNDAIGSSYGYVPYLKQGTDSATGQDVGILTKIDPVESLYRSSESVAYPVSGSECGSTYSGSKSCSKHYFTSFSFNNMNVALVGAHLLAYPTDPDRCSQREAQAQVLVDGMMKYVNAGYELIVLGDLNDYDGDDLDVNNNKPLSMVLDLLKLEGETYELYNIASKLDQCERYTEWWDPNGDCVYDISETSSIDHILVSKNLYNAITSVFVAHSEYDETCDTLYSDHWPVVVDFEF